ncbi:RAB43 [Mytilus edulis]|uniref:RAB43 n=1 Tax=Mytilus edulis TaxID=6550 RepID=A0A8S3TTW9_MYTED|nr:RAB43 [Mytilus edulis]
MAFYPSSADTDDSFDFLFKIVLIGDAGVGKTCVVQRFKSGTYVEKHGSTIGVDFTMKTLKVDGKLVKLQIWDTAGQERFRTITQSYYRSANGKMSKRYAGGSIVQCLIGNKRDLEHLREVNTSEAKNFAQQHNMIDVIETSAKENTNVEQVFLEMATELKRRIGGDSGLASSKSGGISLNTQTVGGGGSSCC